MVLLKTLRAFESQEDLVKMQPLQQQDRGGA